jgi:hypothetical protein
MRGPRRPLLGALLIGVVLVVTLASCNDDSSSSKGSRTTSTTASGSAASGGGGAVTAAATTGTEGAIDAYLRGQNITYAGDCRDARLPRDRGDWCSTLVSGSETGTTATYDLGPVGGKAEKTLTLQRGGSTELTPGHQVGVAGGSVGAPSQLTTEQLRADLWITGNIVLDQNAGIGNGLADVPAGAPTTTTAPPTDTAPPTTTPPTTAPANPVVTPGGGGEQYPPQGQVVVDTPRVTVGSEAVFRGSGCQGGELLQISFDGRPVGTLPADASGAFAGSISIPPGTAPGTHVVTVRGSQCELNVSVVVAGGLAFTGSSSHTGTVVLAGVAAVVVGLVLVVGTRRRRNRRGRAGTPPGVT